MRIDIASCIQDLHHPAWSATMRAMHRRIFSVESKKKLWRPCREARALGL
jgi:hypothetical protein